MYHKPLKIKEKIFAVAPMMDWTDRHCRMFHRVLSKQALLYTEMVVADAIIHGDRDRLLGFNDAEHPVALQIGGSDPDKLAEAARIGEAFGYREINLNVGCPSDRVQSGTFGACLMKEPELVGKCVTAMKHVVEIPVTVKCRIGVDDQVPDDVLPAFAHVVFESGCDALWVHARKAWLNGLSPKQNREVPPLNYELVHALKDNNPDRFIGINGGISALDQCSSHLEIMDGVMMGRTAYQKPAVLCDVDRQLFGSSREMVSDAQILENMIDYCSKHLASGGRISQITRHMVGLFHGQSGARQYRRTLSTDAVKPDADVDVLTRAFSAINQNLKNAA